MAAVRSRRRRRRLLVMMRLLVREIPRGGAGGAVRLLVSRPWIHPPLAPRDGWESRVSVLGSPDGPRMGVRTDKAIRGGYVTLHTQTLQRNRGTRGLAVVFPYTPTYPAGSCKFSYISSRISARASYADINFVADIDITGWFRDPTFSLSEFNA